MSQSQRRSEQRPTRDFSGASNHGRRDEEAPPGFSYQDSGYRGTPPRRPTFESQTGASATTPLNPTGNTGEITRKKSLIRPERSKIDRHHPNYYYRMHAQREGMNVLPSTTGNDPILEDMGESNSMASDSTEMKSLTRDHRRAEREQHGGREEKVEGGRKLSRKDPRSRRSTHVDMKPPKQARKEEVSAPSAWSVYCHVVTFWAPSAILKCCGKRKHEQRQAWREKIGLITIILMFCAGVGFLTFGFTQVVCGTPTPRLKINHVDRGYLIINGRAYDVSRSHHRATLGIQQGANVAFDLGFGGMDATFLFQNVNGACKGLIKPAAGSTIPTDSTGSMGWYFPCKPFRQDGSSKPNATASEYYNGYACHTTDAGRTAYYDLNVQGDVYFTWDDLKNKTRNLVVYSSSVLDLNLINWFDKTQVNYPPIFDKIKDDSFLHGKDVTHMFQAGEEKKAMRCLSEIIRVGSVDTETVGCIASKVVLYVSLVFIGSIVLIKFILALVFGWFLSGKYGVKMGDEGAKSRREEIEAWSNDANLLPPKLPQADRSSKRGSFFPTSSRFSSPYHASERPGSKSKSQPTTMGSQSVNGKLFPPSPMYQAGSNTSRGSLLSSQLDGTAQSRSSFNLLSTADRSSTVIQEPSGDIHTLVVPQPPPEYQPFGYPLAHCICLVTAYNEGKDGLRGTLDSIATSDYPNSHKLILIICDGMVKSEDKNGKTTPDTALKMMRDNVEHPNDVKAFSYVAVANGIKRHNKAKVHAGFYKYGKHSKVPADRQQRVPMIIIAKCGTSEEEGSVKPGNRGKRDSQIILMSFLQKVMFDERMTELEFQMFSNIFKVTGIPPTYYETVLMVDADTKIFKDALTHMNGAMVKEPEIMGLCGETKITNKRKSWVTMIQVFEYFISHHLTKAFESVFGGVTCLPGCFCMYRIKAPKGGQNYWVPILANPDVVEHYSENVVDTLHKKNLLLLGEDRYLSTLMLKTFPKRRQVFVPQAVCKTQVPEGFGTLLSQRRRWINSTVHNLMELVLVRDLCGTFCFSMQFVVFIELIGTVVLPAAISFTVYLIVISFVRKPVPVIPLILLALILGLPAFLVVLTAQRWSYVLWMFIYLLSLPIWNFVLPVYAYWKFDDFSWGDTRKVEGEKKGGHDEAVGEFNSDGIVMKRWRDFESDRRTNESSSHAGFSHSSTWPRQTNQDEYYYSDQY